LLTNTQRRDRSYNLDAANAEVLEEVLKTVDLDKFVKTI
jgi:hypothetical protein